MKTYKAVAQRYCPSMQQNVAVGVYWDEKGQRHERCLKEELCSYRESSAKSLVSPCGHPIATVFPEL